MSSKPATAGLDVANNANLDHLYCTRLTNLLLTNFAAQFVENSKHNEVVDVRLSSLHPTTSIRIHSVVPVTKLHLLCLHCQHAS